MHTTFVCILCKPFTLIGLEKKKHHTESIKRPDFSRHAVLINTAAKHLAITPSRGFLNYILFTTRGFVDQVEQIYIFVLYFVLTNRHPVSPLALRHARRCFAVIRCTERASRLHTTHSFCLVVLLNIEYLFQISRSGRHFHHGPVS